MRINRVVRPASIALAAGASALLLVGLVVPGAIVAVLAVATAWLRPSAPPSDQRDSPSSQ